MDYKTINYTLTAAVGYKEAVSIIKILAEDYKELFKKCDVTITQINNTNYSDLVMLDLNFKNGYFEELNNFESDIINLLPNQFRLLKECE